MAAAFVVGIDLGTTHTVVASAPLGAGVMTIGVPIGLFVIIAAFILTGIYVSKANAEFDQLTREIVEESK